MYGVEVYIARAIKSVQQQTFQNWELIIVNDGTKDRSREIAAKYEQDDSRIRVIDKPNGGLTSARLKGLEYAQGDFLSFIDSDDTLQPEYLEVLYTNIKKYDADLSMCSFNRVLGNKVTPCMLYFPDAITLLVGETIFRDYFLPQLASSKKNATFLPSFLWLRLFKKEIITSNLFVSEQIVYKEDLAFSARLLKKLGSVVIVNKPLYNYHVNRGSLTQKYRENAWGMMTALTKEIEHVIKDVPGNMVNDRKQGCILSAIHFTLMNASRQDYKSFKKEFFNILKEPIVKEVICEINILDIKLAFIVVFFSLRLRCPSILYKYNQSRV